MRIGEYDAESMGKWQEKDIKEMRRFGKNGFKVV